MNEIHAHEVLRMMEGNCYSSKAVLREAIALRFGTAQLFRSCSARGMDIDTLIDFLERKGKFRSESDGFTMDISKVCGSY